MGWDVETEETNMKNNLSAGNMEGNFKDEQDNSISKLTTPKKYSYLEKLETLSLRSPTARHWYETHLKVERKRESKGGDNRWTYGKADLLESLSKM